MPVKGSTSAELLIELDRERPRGLRAQIEDSIRESVRTGRLAAGSPLPSSRALAADLGVTRGVVVSAYEQLTAEGYLRSRIGAGTVVNAVTTATTVHDPVPETVRVEFDLRPAYPDLDLFPRTAWARAARIAMNEMPRDELGYTDIRGLPRLRQAIVDYLGRVRGVATSPERVMVCNGFGHGYGVVLEALRGMGILSAACEDPGYEDSRLTAQRLGMAVRPVPVDDDGLRADRLAATDARVVTLTPAHQAPLGMVLSPERRRQIAGWAADVDGYIIEDDYDAEFRYDRQPIGALQGIAPDRTIYIGTLSKSLAPGLRLGWVVLPPELVEPTTAVRGLVDGATSTFTQSAFATFLSRGDFDRHLRRSRRVYRKRRDALTAALAEHVPDATVGAVRAGLHVPVHLPHTMDEDRVVDAAEKRGVLVRSLASFRTEGSEVEPALVVGFGRLRESDAVAAARILEQSVAAAQD